MFKPYLMFVKSWGIPSRHHGSFNTKSWSNDWHDLGVTPHDFGNLHLYHQWEVIYWHTNNYCGTVVACSLLHELNLSLVDLHHQSWDPPVSWQFLSLANMWRNQLKTVEITNHYGYKWLLTTRTWRLGGGFWPQLRRSFSLLQADNLPKNTIKNHQNWTAHVLQFPSCPKQQSHIHSDTQAFFHGANKSQSWTFDLGSRSFAWSFSVAIAQVCFNGLSTGLLLLQNGTGYVEGEIGWY